MASKKSGFPTIDRSGMGTDKAGFLGPLYTEPNQNLGPVSVGDPKGGMASPDPLGLKKTGHGGKGKKKGY